MSVRAQLMLLVAVFVALGTLAPMVFGWDASVRWSAYAASWARIVEGVAVAVLVFRYYQNNDP